MVVKEFREWFFRHNKVTTGSKPDQEPSFVKTYLVAGISKFNTFLRGDVPSELVYKKLFESIPFKLNKEDTASSDNQGLVRKATDIQSESRTLNPNTDYTLAVVSHQLPEVILENAAGDSVVGSPIQVGGLKLTNIKRSVSGLFRRVYKLEVNPANSIEINSSSKKVQLINDTISPGSYSYYGTDSDGVRGWFQAPFISFKRYLTVDFTKNNNTPSIISDGNDFTVNIVANSVYKIEALLFINPQATGGLKIAFSGSAALSNIISELFYIDDSTNTIALKTRIVTLGSGTGIAGVGNGICKIEGSLSCATSGTFSLQFCQNVTNTSSSIVKQGSYFILEEIPKIS